MYVSLPVAGWLAYLRDPGCPGLVVNSDAVGVLSLASPEIPNDNCLSLLSPFWRATPPPREADLGLGDRIPRHVGARRRCAHSGPRKIRLSRSCSRLPREPGEPVTDSGQGLSRVQHLSTVVDEAETRFAPSSPAATFVSRNSFGGKAWATPTPIVPPPMTTTRSGWS